MLQHLQMLYVTFVYYNIIYHNTSCSWININGKNDGLKNKTQINERKIYYSWIETFKS